MDMMKTYGWQSPEKLKFINENPQVLSLLYDLGILPEEISARVRGYVEEERERCAKLAEAQRAYCFDESEEECNSGKCDSAMADAIARKIRELK